jgi:hypothetical protein
VYNEDPDASDPVPWIASTGPFHWIHPRMRAVGLGKPGSPPTKVFECGRGDKAEQSWEGVNAPEPKLLKHVKSLFSFHLHTMKPYRHRMAAQFCPDPNAAVPDEQHTSSSHSSSHRFQQASTPNAPKVDGAASTETSTTTPSSDAKPTTDGSTTDDAADTPTTGTHALTETLTDTVVAAIRADATTMDGDQDGSESAKSADSDGYFHHQEVADAKAAERLAAPAGTTGGSQMVVPDITSQLDDRHGDGHFGVPASSASDGSSSVTSSSSDSSSTLGGVATDTGEDTQRFASLTGTRRTLDRLNNLMESELDMLSKQTVGER